MNHRLTRTALAALIAFAGLTGTAHAGDTHGTDPVDSIPDETTTTTAPPADVEVDVEAPCGGTLTVRTVADTRLEIVITVADEVFHRTALPGSYAVFVDYPESVTPQVWRVQIPAADTDVGGRTPACPPPTTTTTPPAAPIDCPAGTVLTPDGCLPSFLPQHCPPHTNATPDGCVPECVSTATGQPVPCTPPVCDAPAPVCTADTAPPTENTSTVPPETITVPRPSLPPPAPSTPTAAAEALPATGTGSTAGMLAIGAVLLALGIVAVRRARTTS